MRAGGGSVFSCRQSHPLPRFKSESEGFLFFMLPPPLSLRAPLPWVNAPSPRVLGRHPRMPGQPHPCVPGQCPHTLRQRPRPCALGRRPRPCAKGQRPCLCAPRQCPWHAACAPCRYPRPARRVDAPGLHAASMPGLRAASAPLAPMRRISAPRPHVLHQRPRPHVLRQHPPPPRAVSAPLAPASACGLHPCLCKCPLEGIISCSF